MSVENDVLQRIRPSAEEAERVDGAARSLENAVKAYMEEHGIDAGLSFVGSYAKGTFLDGNDLDLFIMFPRDVPKETMVDTGLKIGEDVLHGHHEYSEHPYSSGYWEGVDVDLVPCYRMEPGEKLLTSVDRSPLHTRYVISKMSDAQKDETRLLKAFMKGIGAYGAEPENRGFSGYLCELLILKYGSFLGTLEAAAETWKEGFSITIEEKGPPMVSALVVYDPVDKNRNVASAVHTDTLALFIVAAQDYLMSPSERFFFPVPRRLLSAREIEMKAEGHGTRILTVVFKRPDIVEDNLYGQVWKTEDAICRKLDEYDFVVLRSEHVVGKEDVQIAYELDGDKLSRTERHMGPPVWVQRASNDFLRKWKDNPYGAPFIDEGSWCVVTERMYSSAREMVQDEAAISGIGRELDTSTMKVLSHEESIEKADRLLLTELMHPMFPWQENGN
ncbi:MAG: CCA tRNA nucleotidyltransferase [Thermoplasmata archaeon]|nr:CCA tRNA nucleotidyltransferase [Thermoplasmata archaeon]